MYLNSLQLQEFTSTSYSVFLLKGDLMDKIYTLLESYLLYYSKYQSLSENTKCFYI